MTRATPAHSNARYAMPAAPNASPQPAVASRRRSAADASLKRARELGASPDSGDSSTASLAELTSIVTGGSGSLEASASRPVRPVAAPSSTGSGWPQRQQRLAPSGVSAPQLSHAVT